MKSNILKRYVLRILIYSIVYIITIWVLDNVFNGFVIEWLYYNLSRESYITISQNRVFFSFLTYVLGLVIISVIYVIKLSKLLNLASRSIKEDNSIIFTEKCPEELREFSGKLKDFKYELKVNEQARKQAEQQKNDLVVYLAHDLKTPLTSVIGYLSLLEEAEELSTAQRAKYIGIALEKAYRLEQLINEFFEITRMNLQTIPTQKVPVNLTILLVQIINEFYPMLEEKRMNVIENIEQEIVVFADADKLARVFDNLFRNAVNYSFDETSIVCTAYKQEDYVFISLKNKGAQIPKEKLNYLFDKFYRLDNSRQSSTGGAGLGLAIAKQIVEAHNGTVEATCNDGITEFLIKLPK